MTAEHPVLARRPALGGWSTGDPAVVHAAELAPRPMVALRVDPDSVAAGRVERILPLPAPGTVAGRDDRAVLWLGPDEWLVVEPPETEAAALLDALTEALDGRWGSAVEVSAARTVVELTGPRALEVLAKGCPLDLHPRAWGGGRCARTLLARAQILLWTPEPDTHRVLVGTSYARYLTTWLTDAAEEFLAG